MYYLAAAGDFTFARFTRFDGLYRMQAMRGTSERFDKKTNESLIRQSDYNWPHAFAKMEASAENIFAGYGSNHIHTVSVDHTAEIKVLCEILDVDFDGFGSVV